MRNFALDSADSLLGELRSLNRQFLLLLGRRPSYGAVPNRSTPLRSGEAALSKLKQLDVDVIERVADCPFSLFDLHFDNVGHWCKCVDAADAVCFFDPRADDAEQRFLESALYFVWCAVRIDMRFAKFAFGMSEALASQFNRVQIVKLGSISRIHGQRLRPRWLEHPCFWPDLVRFAEKNATEPLLAAKFLGCQLLAGADLPQDSSRLSRSSVTIAT